MTGKHQHINTTTSSNSQRQAARRLALSLVLTLAFVGVETTAGLLGNSLALLTDAAHNLTDVLALALSWFALRLALRPAHPGKTYGYGRAGILAALINSASLAIVSLGIFYEAYHRLRIQAPVNASLLAWVGALAFVVNLITAWLVHHGSDQDLNLRSAFVHLMGDVASTAGAAIAGVVILFTGWNWLDPMVSALIGVFILVNAWQILRETLEILLEGTPSDINMEALVQSIRAVPGVRDVHDLHVWSITHSLRSLSAHLLTDDIALSSGAQLQTEVRTLLRQRYGITHATLQLECERCSTNPLFCDLVDHQ